MLEACKEELKALAQEIGGHINRKLRDVFITLPAIIEVCLWVCLSIHLTCAILGLLPWTIFNVSFSTTFHSFS